MSARWGHHHARRIPHHHASCCTGINKSPFRCNRRGSPMSIQTAEQHHGTRSKRKIYPQAKKMEPSRLIVGWKAGGRYHACQRPSRVLVIDMTKYFAKWAHPLQPLLFGGSSNITTRTQTGKASRTRTFALCPGNSRCDVELHCGEYIILRHSNPRDVVGFGVRFQLILKFSRNETLDGLHADLSGKL